MTGPSARPFCPTLHRYGPAVATSLLIAILSLLPAQCFKTVSTTLPPVPGSDKIVHALMYAALTLSVLHALPAAAGRRLSAALRAALAASLYGVAMEICQRLITNTRSADYRDALANSAGALTAALLSAVLHHHSKKENL